MDALIKFWSMELTRLFIGSGSNSMFAYFQFSNIDLNSLNTWGQVGQTALGIIGSIVAIVYGVYQIKLIMKKLKDDKK